MIYVFPKKLHVKKEKNTEALLRLTPPPPQSWWTEWDRQIDRRMTDNSALEKLRWV